MTAIDVDTIARSYIEAVGRHDLAALDDLLGDDAVAAFAGAPLDKTGWIAALRRLLPALLRNEIREIFVDGDRACVVYDFVTDTEAGAVRCVELLTVTDGRIRSIELVLDRVAFAPVNQALSALQAP
ncbi:nuclear transport factor 2 family protein [Leifsonia poae]|uniref:nuclear transport factor 2 family protein n=1 Tax=Leifsonia poae TaxID=110933 RepID=UPI001CBAFEC5|nr:nuclear transport factor 2 family protein [Leifsonia poae]